eukprot:TRINITY_DN5964_c2_g1_i3.p1 TRINITY_DN5964_c2_g1~~TRINITY_DN5964_c2_g1_i3.p1  ORF type:complete len:346 (+),score=94.35 TRINITY_DN5964_c2_g1_i3:80-1117(+)
MLALCKHCDCSGCEECCGECRHECGEVLVPRDSVSRFFVAFACVMSTAMAFFAARGYMRASERCTDVLGTSLICAIALSGGNAVGAILAHLRFAEQMDEVFSNPQKDRRSPQIPPCVPYACCMQCCLGCQNCVTKCCCGSTVAVRSRIACEFCCFDIGLFLYTVYVIVAYIWILDMGGGPYPCNNTRDDLGTVQVLWTVFVLTSPCIAFISMTCELGRTDRRVPGHPQSQGLLLVSPPPGQPYGAAYPQPPPQQQAMGGPQWGGGAAAGAWGQPQQQPQQPKQHQWGSPMGQQQPQWGRQPQQPQWQRQQQSGPAPSAPPPPEPSAPPLDWKDGWNGGYPPSKPP